MKKIDEIDKNFKADTTIEEPDVRFYDVRKAPFKIYGLYEPQTESDMFRRLPQSLADEVNEGFAVLAKHTAGGRVRFRTNSRYVGIRVEYPWVDCGYSHIPFTGSAGFDLYTVEEGRHTYRHTFKPTSDINEKLGYESLMHFDDNSMRDIVINFPLYNPVSSLYICLQESAVVEVGSEYKYEKPILYYGSSITQGGCASRPGNSYQAIISRRYDTNYINLGFSGSGKAEENIMEYMAQLDFSVFVLDYDHNAPSPEYLEETHYRAYEIIRKYKPDCPIVMITKPDVVLRYDHEIKRRATVFNTYQKARLGGDKNVYFIDGYSLFAGEGRDCCTVDGTHPNDLGFWRMADVIGRTIEPLLLNKEIV